MEVLVLLIFASGICVASAQDDWQQAAQNCPLDTPWGAGNFSDSDCDDRDLLPCNGLGTCVCGQCICNQRDDPQEVVSGRFCECTNFLCDQYLGPICSGPDRGQCVCNKCECKPGWSGDDCACEDSVENCRNPQTGEICSNNGVCECNSCRQCNVVERGRCSGSWCENCPAPHRRGGGQRERHRSKEERKQRRRERKQRKKHKDGGEEPAAVSEHRKSAAELCPADAPWGPEAFDDSYCKETESSPPCSGRGTCACGECSCDERADPQELVSGQFCECTNFLCDRFNGRLCSGPDHGECICNKCQCEPGWAGEACECEDSVDNCRNPVTGDICSGQGICSCNACVCSVAEEGRYSGRWCEDCPICKGKCSQYKSCVQCQAFGTGDLSEEECMDQCTLFNSTVVQVASAETEDERLCTFFDENDCRFTFVYGYDEDRYPFVRVQQTLECPPSVGSGTGIPGPWWKVLVKAREGLVSLYLGHCDQRTVRFQCVAERGRCEPVSDCGGNAGTFLSPEECQRECHTGAPPVSDASCDRSQCPWSRWSHYLARNCHPLYDKGFCCPTRFSCRMLSNVIQEYPVLCGFIQ